MQTRQVTRTRLYHDGTQTFTANYVASMAIRGACEKKLHHIFIIFIFEQNSFRPTMLNSSHHYTRSKVPKTNTSTTNPHHTRYDLLCAFVWPPLLVFLVFYRLERVSAGFDDSVTMTQLSEVVAAAEHVLWTSQWSSHSLDTRGRDVSTLFDHWTSPSSFSGVLLYPISALAARMVLLWPHLSFAVSPQSRSNLSHALYSSQLRVSECWNRVIVFTTFFGACPVWLFVFLFAVP
jgi:hypothetical protein